MYRVAVQTRPLFQQSLQVYLECCSEIALIEDIEKYALASGNKLSHVRLLHSLSIITIFVAENKITQVKQWLFSSSIAAMSWKLMPMEEAEALVKQGQIIKAEALGPSYQVHSLSEILDESMLVQVNLWTDWILCLILV